MLFCYLTLERMTTSEKKDLYLWEQSKQAACSERKLCKPSALKNLHATKIYQQRGGKYKGKKSPVNSLSQWTRQRWSTFDGSPSHGIKRYLPGKTWSHLTESQIRRTNEAKKKGFLIGKQYVRQPKDIAAISRRFRNSPKSKSPRRH